MTVQLSRDPFRRTTLVRQLVPKSERRECQFCGLSARFRYGQSPDSGRTHIDKYQFCCIDCYKAYHGE